MREGREGKEREVLSLGGMLCCLREFLRGVGIFGVSFLVFILSIASLPPPVGVDNINIIAYPCPYPTTPRGREAG